MLANHTTTASQCRQYVGGRSRLPHRHVVDSLAAGIHPGLQGRVAAGSPAKRGFRLAKYTFHCLRGDVCVSSK